MLRQRKVSPLDLAVKGSAVTTSYKPSSKKGRGHIKVLTLLWEGTQLWYCEKGERQPSPAYTHITYRTYSATDSGRQFLFKLLFPCRSLVHTTITCLFVVEHCSWDSRHLSFRLSRLATLTHLIVPLFYCFIVLLVFVLIVFLLPVCAPLYL